MEDAELESRLTSAAREALDEVIADFRRQLMITAKESASSLTGEVKEISVRDIFEALRVVPAVREYRASSRADSLGRLGAYIMVLLGVTASLASGAYLVLAGPAAQSSRLVAVVVAGTAAVMAGLAAVLAWSRQRVSYHQLLVGSRGEPDYSLAFIAKWQEIELAIRSLVSARVGESAADAPFSVLVAVLARTGLLDANDEKLVATLLATRSKILHTGLKLDEAAYRKHAREAARVLERLTSEEARTHSRSS